MRGHNHHQNVWENLLDIEERKRKKKICMHILYKEYACYILWNNQKQQFNKSTKENNWYQKQEMI